MADTRHADAQVQFDVPDGWVNRTIVVWSAPAGAAAVPPNVVVAFDTPKPGEALGAYVTRQLAELQRTAKGFELDTKRDTTLGGRPAVELVFRWAGGPSGMQQRQVFAMVPDGRVASVANTASAADFAAADATFAEILQSFRWAA